MVDRYEALARLSKLKAAGVLTEDEFSAEKAKLLSAPDEAGLPSPDANIVGDGAALRRRALWILPLALIALAILIGINVGQNAARPPTEAATAVTSDTPVPACDSAQARALLANAIEQGPLSKIANLRLLDTGNIVERSYNAAKPSRVCAADLTLNTGEEHKGYEIHLTSDRSGYLLQLMDDPGSAALPSPAPSASLAPTVREEKGVESSPASGGVAVVSDRWLSGLWMTKNSEFNTCGDDADNVYKIAYGADHSYGEYEASGTWRLTGTTLRTRGIAEGEPFSDRQVITAADTSSFTARDSDGTSSEYIRCSR